MNLFSSPHLVLNPGNLLPLSVLPNYWLLATLFTNQNQVGAGFQKLSADSPANSFFFLVVVGGDVISIRIQAATGLLPSWTLETLLMIPGLIQATCVKAAPLLQSGEN